MAYTDFIAAIDLGSSHMVGMVGVKDPSGVLSIIAYEVENSDTCIRRGCVYNIKETAAKIVRLIRKLENKLGGSRIAKVYMGVGGQSLRSVDHSVSRVLGDGVVTKDLLRELDRECRKYRPENLDVLAVVSPVYYLDNRQEKDPEGMNCSRIEVRYKLIVGRPALRHAVTANMVEQTKVDVAGVIVSPLALADLILTEQEKEEGCALIDFGAGVTSVTMFREGRLAGLYVIPLGSHLITRDLMSLGISEREAERVKRTYGNALWEKAGEQQMVTVDLVDGQRSGEIRLSDINITVEARSREIIENIVARMEDAGVAKEPGYGLVISGGGASLNHIREALGERLKMDVRFASVRKDKVSGGEMIANNPSYTTAAALLLKGTENCAFYVAPEPERKVVEHPFVKETPVVQSPVDETVMETETAGTGRKEEERTSPRDSSRSLSGSGKERRRSKDEGPGLFKKWFGNTVDKVGESIGKALEDEDNRHNN